MNKFRKLTLACFLASSLFTVGHAQSSTPLQPGPPIERELSGDQVHTFTIDLEENTRLQLVVEQKGIDVIIRVLTPDGKTLGDYDTPNGPTGPENVSFVGLAAGTYSITVAQLNPTSPAKGRYEIKIIELRKATDQELNERKDLEIVRARAIELLKDLDGLISQIKTPKTRISARLQASDLLCEDDEKRADKYLTDAIADLKEYIASIDPTEPDYGDRHSTIWQLRFQIAQTLVQIDPDAALNFIYSTVPPTGAFSTREQILQESGLEMAISNEVMSSNPKRSLEIAKRSLKQGYPSELVQTVRQLRDHDAKLATELTNEILDKLLGEKLISNLEASQFAINLLGFNNMVVSSVEGAAQSSHILTDDQYKVLIQKLLDEVQSFSSNGPNTPGLQSLMPILGSLTFMGPRLDRIVAGSSETLSKKYKEVTGVSNNFISVPQGYQDTLEQAIESVDKAPPEIREQLYLAVANRAATSGDTLRARQIIDAHIKSPYQRREALTNVQQQEISRAINGGKLEDALRMIGSLRTPRERASHLSQMTASFGMGLKRATALNLLEQARALLPASPHAQDDEQMRALFDIAGVFSRYDSKRAFEILDPLVDQFNEICAAARTLDGFGGGFFENEELTENGNSVADAGSQMTSVLGKLALTNFERAKAAADRIRLVEVRLNAYLDIAQNAIEGDNN